MSVMHDWARDWGVTPMAVLDLMQRIGVGFESPNINEIEGLSESAVSQRVRLEAAALGFPLWRNQVGALMDDGGRLVRYGLANDSKKMNENVKSSDFIACRPKLITAAMVGTVIGQFTAREIKPDKWVYTGQGREPAQLKFGEIVLRLGGDFKFATGEGTFK